MSNDCPKYAELKELAKELRRNTTTLIALDAQNDPFYINPRREAEAKWFAKLWRRFNCRPGTHTRRVHYVLISQEQPVLILNGKPYENTINCMMFLNRASRDARYLGLVSMRDVVDRRNDEAVINLADDEEDGASIEIIGGLQEHVPPSFKTPSLAVAPPTILQRYHVEIWCEKSTMNDILLPLGERYGINVVTGLGELSLTRCVELVDRARASDKPVRILYVSDFDPGGNSMPVAVARKIEFVVRREGHDLDIQVRPVVLSHEQCIQYRLPRTPIKDTEKRAARFEARFGEGATELDALEALHPGELERILEQEIARYYDDTLDGRIDDVVNEVQEGLDDISTRSSSGMLRRSRRLKPSARKSWRQSPLSRRRQSRCSTRSMHDLEAEAPDVDDFDWPEPDDGDEDDDPLFDSTRDYVEQVDRYKEHQGKTIERKVTEKVCINCGETFDASREDQKYCSAKCNNAYFYKQQSGKGKVKECIGCGEKFIAANSKQKFCGLKCEEANRAPRDWAAAYQRRRRSKS